LSHRGVGWPSWPRETRLCSPLPSDISEAHAHRLRLALLAVSDQPAGRCRNPQRAPSERRLAPVLERRHKSVRPAGVKESRPFRIRRRALVSHDCSGPGLSRGGADLITSFSDGVNLDVGGAWGATEPSIIAAKEPSLAAKKKKSDFLFVGKTKGRCCPAVTSLRTIQGRTIGAKQAKLRANVV